MSTTNRKTERATQVEAPRGAVIRSSDPLSTAAAILSTVLLIAWPYGEVTADLFQVRLLGYSVFATVAPTILTILTVWLTLIRFPRQASIPFIAGMSVVFVAYARNQLHIAEPDQTLVTEIVGRRCFLLIPCYLICAPVATSLRWFRKWAPIIVLFNGITGAAVGIAYSLGILGYRVSPLGDEAGEALWELGERTRASGLFASSNVFAHFLVLALALAASKRMSPILRWVLYAILCGGILASQSRTALLAAIVVIAGTKRADSGGLLRRTLGLGLLLLTIAIGGLLVMQNSAESVRDRFEYQSGDDISVRGAKTLLGITAIFSDPSTVMFGARQSEIVVGPDPSQQISDNSYIAVATSVGLPFSLLLVYFLWRGAGMYIPRHHHDENAALLFVIVIAAAALVNNSVLWDVYTYHASVIFWLFISHKAWPEPTHRKTE